MKIIFLKTLTYIFLISIAFIPAVRAQGSNSIAVTVTIIKQIASVDIRVTPRNRSSRAGQTASLQATIRNTGNGDDYFKLTASSSLGWEVDFSQGDIVGPIEPGEKKVSPVTVTVPADARKGDSNRVTITATSQFDPSVSDSSFSTIIAR